MITEWHDLFAATADSAAALTGLVFVGVSINLARILSMTKLPQRALLALTFLLTILILSILMLIPGQSVIVEGVEVTVTGIILWIFTVRMDFSIYKNTTDEFRPLYLFNIGVNQFATIPYIVSGIFLLNGHESGIYWIAGGFILCFIKSMMDSWVLLVEINR